MQGSGPWFTPTISALQNQQTDNSNYFYNYSQSWERSSNGYQTEYYNNQNQYPMNNNNMRTCNENPGFGSESSNFQCPPMYFRQDTGHIDNPSNHIPRSRQDRNQPIPIPTKNRLPKSATRPNDSSETENFSSVFTQSLTSLYSQDSEANFEEKNYKCDQNPLVNVSEQNCSREKVEDLSNGCNTEYNFNPVFSNDMEDQQQQHATTATNPFENLKVKTEYPSMDDIRYDNYSLDDTYLKRRRSLAEAYNRKRKRSMPSMSYRMPNDSSESVDIKPADMFQSQSQWIPNSIRACQGNETSSNDTYQPSDFSSGNQITKYDSFENGRSFKRHPMKSRGSRGRGTGNETRVQNAIKRIPKKVSPLTVYAKILDDRILEITCRRYKKRTKPAATEEVTSGQNVYDNNPLRTAESLENIYQSVKEVVQGVVDRISTLFSSKPDIDLSTISPNKAKELLFRFCNDYSLDYRDFQDFNQIINTNVTSENDENIATKRKRRRTSDRDDLNVRKSERINEREEISDAKRDKNVSKDNNSERNSEKSVSKVVENTPKTERKSGRPKKLNVVNDQQPRVLRSLPSRQPGYKMGKKMRKSERYLVKNRYPKRRNMRGGKVSRGPSGKKLKILIDLSQDNGYPEVLELESDSSRFTSNPGLDKEEDEGDDEGSKNRTKEEEEEEEEEDEEEDSRSSRETPKSLSNTPAPSENPQADETDVTATAAVEDVKRESEESRSECKYRSVLDSPRTSSPALCIAAETLKTIKKEVENDDDDDTTLRQPPQLVCMAPEDRNDDKHFLDPSQGKSTNNSSTNQRDERLSMMYLQANGLEEAEAPSPPKLKRTSSAKYSRSFSRESNSSDFLPMDSDDPDGKLVIDMDAHEHQSEKQTHLNVDKEEEEEEEETKTVLNSEQDQSDPKPVDFSNSSSTEEKTKDDDCVVISSEDSTSKKSTDVIDLVMKQKPSPPEDKHSLLKEKLLEKPILKKVEDQLLEMEKFASNSNTEKCQSKAEQDESILRTLLLESEVMANTSSADGTAPVISGIANLAGQESATNFDFLKNSDNKMSQISTFPTDPPMGLSDAMKLLKYQSYHEAYANSSSPDTFDDSQKQFKDGTSVTNASQADSKDIIAKDPQQLKEKIKKLKNEIVYLQLMAEQKEKEKIAIVCFKKYKEEILKRIYKAYTFSVQDHVRDWIFSRRENSADIRPTTESASSNAHKVHRNDSSRISELTKPVVESCRDLSPYPSPAPAHAASNHRPQSIHSPQSLSKNPRNAPQTGEKVSTVETMVAKASENYGLDMRNLRDGLRTSPDASTAISGTILQKVLSSSSSRNSSPEQYRSWSPERALKRNSVTPKPTPPVVPKPYSEPYAPLDIMMPQKDASQKNSDLYRNSPETSRLPRPFQGSERSQIQSLLSEPVQLKPNRNPYRAWSIQAGGRISEDRSKHPKPTNLSRQSVPMSSSTNMMGVESPLQRQLNSHKAVARPNFAVPSSLEVSNYGQHSSMHDRRERSASVSGERVHEKKLDEDRRHLAYGSNTMSSNSTMPYGGHIIRNNASPLTTALTNNKPNAPAAEGSSASSNNNSGSNNNTNSGANSTPLCMGCGVSDAKFLCSGCRKHWYCSPQCQSLRWPEHSRVCAGRMYSQSASSYS